MEAEDLGGFSDSWLSDLTDFEERTSLLLLAFDLT
jgi:hypothetical protein